jgi:hypothetical protein
MFEVGLNPGSGGRRLAWMRSLCGQDELEIGQLAPGAITELLGRMVVAVPGASLGPADVANATIADRDRLVAGLYAQAFGDCIESRVDCVTCQQRFEFAFSLSALLSDLDDRAREGARAYAVGAGSGDDRFYDLGDGVQFRLPTVADERALADLPRTGAADERAAASALLERCVRMDGEARPIPIADVEAAMEAVAPMLSLELPVRCALCDAAQTVDFDLVQYLLAALARARPLLVREIHALASAYRWSFAEIVGLPRELRRAQVEVIAFAREGAELAP